MYKGLCLNGGKEEKKTEADGPISRRQGTFAPQGLTKGFGWGCNHKFSWAEAQFIRCCENLVSL